MFYCAALLGALLCSLPLATEASSDNTAEDLTTEVTTSKSPEMRSCCLPDSFSVVQTTHGDCSGSCRAPRGLHVCSPRTYYLLFTT